ncbi:hypothetical protein ACJX0J_013504, partial [Zea mays]
LEVYTCNVANGPEKRKKRGKLDIFGEYIAEGKKDYLPSSTSTLPTPDDHVHLVHALYMIGNDDGKENNTGVLTQLKINFVEDLVSPVAVFMIDEVTLGSTMNTHAVPRIDEKSDNETFFTVTQKYKIIALVPAAAGCMQSLNSVAHGKILKSNKSETYLEGFRLSGIGCI